MILFGFSIDVLSLFLLGFFTFLVFCGFQGLFFLVLFLGLLWGFLDERLIREMEEKGKRQRGCPSRGSLGFLLGFFLLSSARNVRVFIFVVHERVWE